MSAPAKHVRSAYTVYTDHTFQNPPVTVSASGSTPSRSIPAQSASIRAPLALSASGAVLRTQIPTPATVAAGTSASAGPFERSVQLGASGLSLATFRAHVPVGSDQSSGLGADGVQVSVLHPPQPANPDFTMVPPSRLPVAHMPVGRGGAGNMGPGPVLRGPGHVSPYSATLPASMPSSHAHVGVGRGSMPPPSRDA